MRTAAAMAGLMLLTACGSDPEPAVDGATREEAEALNDAAEMLDQSEPPPEVLAAPASAGNTAR